MSNIRLVMGIVSGSPLDFGADSGSGLTAAQRRLRGAAEELSRNNVVEVVTLSPSYNAVELPYGFWGVDLTTMIARPLLRHIPILHAPKDSPLENPPEAAIASPILGSEGGIAWDDVELNQLRAAVEATRWHIDIWPGMLGKDQFSAVMLDGPVPILAGAHYLASGKAVAFLGGDALDSKFSPLFIDALVPHVGKAKLLTDSEAVLKQLSADDRVQRANVGADSVVVYEDIPASSVRRFLFDAVCNAHSWPDEFPRQQWIQSASEFFAVRGVPDIRGGWEAFQSARCLRDDATALPKFYRAVLRTLGNPDAYPVVMNPNLALIGSQLKFQSLGHPDRTAHVLEHLGGIEPRKFTQAMLGLSHRIAYGSDVYREAIFLANVGFGAAAAQMLSTATALGFTPAGFSVML